MRRYRMGTESLEAYPLFSSELRLVECIETAWFTNLWGHIRFLALSCD